MKYYPDVGIQRMGKKVVECSPQVRGVASSNPQKVYKILFRSTLDLAAINHWDPISYPFLRNNWPKNLIRLGLLLTTSNITYHTH